jgi:hypothetical protein
MRTRTYIAMFILILVVLLTACSRPISSPVSSEVPSSIPSTIVSQAIPAPSPPEVLPANRVEVVYFHAPSRCATCLCFEEQAVYVVNTYFKAELESGTLVFDVCDLSDRSKAALIRKYDAFAAQLFINTVKGNVDSIKNIEEIWKWRCVSDNEAFNEKLRSIIEQELKDIG